MTKTCANCGERIAWARVIGWYHVDSGSYWCHLGMIVSGCEHASPGKGCPAIDEIGY